MHLRHCAHIAVDDFIHQSLAKKACRLGQLPLNVCGGMERDGQEKNRLAAVLVFALLTRADAIGERSFAALGPLVYRLHQESRGYSR